MKKFILGLVLMVTAAGASADCFKFINGRGPDRVGNYMFAATATSVCVKIVSGFAGNYVQVSLTDAEGDLALLTGGGNFENMTIQGGNINGSSVNLNGTDVKFSVEYDNNLGITKGTMKLKAGRQFEQTYLIIGSR